MPPVSYRSVLARNLRVARAAADLSQAEVADGMRRLGFDTWLSQTTSSAERGKRRVNAEETLALAFVLGTSVVRLLSPTEDDDEVSFPSGEAVSVADAIARVQGGVIARAGVATVTATVPGPLAKTE